MLLPPAALGSHPQLCAAAAAAAGPLGFGPELPGPQTDLERFLTAASPALPVVPGLPLSEALRRLTLADVWGAFLDASLVGSPVATLGGSRGPSTAYFVPYLSAMQVFVEPQGGRQQHPGDAQDQRGGGREAPAGSWAAIAAGGTRPAAASAASSAGTGGSGSGDSSPGSSSAPGSGSGGTPVSAAGSARSSVSGVALPPLPVGVTNAGRLYSCDTDGWTSTLQVLCEHMEHELPFHREPITLQLEAMSAPPPSGGAGAGGSGGGRPPAVGPALAEARLVDLHPASWFAVAWYPVYRIPDAPLSARFLCFYSLALPLQLLAEAEAAEAEAAAAEAAAAASVATCEAEGTGAVVGAGGAAAGGLAMLGLEELRLPIVGLKWCDLRGERWFEPIAEPAAAAGAASDDSEDDEDGEDDGEGGNGEVGDGDGGATTAAADVEGDADADAASVGTGGDSSGSCSCCAPPQRRPPAGASDASGEAGARNGRWSPAQRSMEMQARLAELQATAERLARGSWLKVLDAQGSRALKLYHSDFEFFHTRS